MRKKGDSITFDFQGTSPNLPYATNAFPHIVRALFATLPLSQYFFPDMPVGAGLLEPFDIVIPEGTCLNAPLESAISMSPSIATPPALAMHQCMNKAMFASPLKKSVSCPAGGSARFFGYGGLNQRGMMVAGPFPGSLNSAGGGANPDKDGVDSIGFSFVGATDSLDTEHGELQYPFLTLFRKIAKDQHGFGKYRGGSGVSYGFAIYGTKSFYIVPLGNSWVVPEDIGLFGGYAATVSPAIFIPDANVLEQIREPDVHLPTSLHEVLEQKSIKGNLVLEVQGGGHTLPEGAVFVITGVSGPGYGDVLERDPESVMKDLRADIISHWTAQNVYHVAYDQKTLQVDHEGTELLRAKERKNRIQRGVPLKEFEKEWLKKRPPEAALKNYGKWPDAG